MDFGKILSRAWQIVWNNKALWIFGILASCSQGGGGGGGGSNFSTDSGQTTDLPPQLQQFFLEIERFFRGTSEQTIALWVVVLVCVALLVALLFWVLSIYGRVGLIKGTLQAQAGQKIAFRALARESFGSLGKALGMNLLLALVPFAIGLIVAVAAILLTVGTLGIGVLCILPLVCVFVPLAIAYTLYVELANVALIGENLSFNDAINRAWQVFRANFWNFVVLGLILLVGGFLVSLVLAIPVVLVAAPLLIGIFQGTKEAFGSGLLISGICLALAIPVLILVNGIVQSYIHTAWTLAYFEVSGPAASKATRKPAAPRKPASRRKTS